MIDEIQPLAAIMDACPALGCEGWGNPTPEERRTLAGEGEAFEVARRWIRANLRPARRINRQRSCYGMKRAAERATGRYIDTGTFAAALLAEGYALTDDFSPCANVLESSARAAMRAAGIRTFGRAVPA